MIDAARQADPAGDYRCASAGALPLADKSCDLVIAFMSLQMEISPYGATSFGERVRMNAGKHRQPHQRTSREEAAISDRGCYDRSRTRAEADAARPPSRMRWPVSRSEELSQATLRAAVLPYLRVNTLEAFTTHDTHSHRIGETFGL
jgi:hypothetical protein